MTEKLSVLVWLTINTSQICIIPVVHIALASALLRRKGRLKRFEIQFSRLRGLSEIRYAVHGASILTTMVTTDFKSLHRVGRYLGLITWKGRGNIRNKDRLLC